LRLIDELDREIAGWERELRRLGADHRYVPFLCTVPGISWILAYTIAAELGDIDRFPWCEEHLDGLVGLFRAYEQRKRALGRLNLDDLLLYWHARLGRGPLDSARGDREGVPVPVLSTALYERFSSQGAAQFADKLLSAMRKEFGGHSELAVLGGS
jgi:hypothetical protein